MKLPVSEKRVEDDVKSLVYRLRSYRLLRNLLIGFILVALVNVMFTSLFYTPKMYRIIENNRELVLKYEILQNRIKASQHRLEEIKHRDNYVYRPLFSSDTVTIDGIYSPYDQTKYASVADDEYSPLMMGTWLELDQLARSLYLESKSLDDLQVLAKDKERIRKLILFLFAEELKYTFRSSCHGLYLIDHLRDLLNRLCKILDILDKCLNITDTDSSFNGKEPAGNSHTCVSHIADKHHERMHESRQELRFPGGFIKHRIGIVEGFNGIRFLVKRFYHQMSGKSLFHLAVDMSQIFLLSSEMFL